MGKTRFLVSFLFPLAMEPSTFSVRDEYLGLLFSDVSQVSRGGPYTVSAAFTEELFKVASDEMQLLSSRQNLDVVC